MRVEVELFGELRSLSNKGSRFELDLEEGATVGKPLGVIGVRNEHSWNAAINGKSAYADTVVADGARVILFPPAE